MLEDTIESVSELSDVYQELLGVWLRGNEAELEEALIKDMQEVPDPCKTLIITKNRN